jgi:mutator protein MutT
VAADFPEPPLFAMGTSVYAERDGNILLLKRAEGAMIGSWYLPGGALDPGETIEECAVRELEEEAGLIPDSPLELIGLIQMPLYGRELFIASYSCACPKGDVVLSHEHSDHRWMPAAEYRRESLTDENVTRIETANERVGRVVRGIQRDLDTYLKRRA